MIWLVLIPALMTQQPTVPVPSSQQPYERPLVRPFEPASTFGRDQAQGDGESDAWRKPLTAPVTVDAYRHSYEVSPTDTQIAYEQAVAQRELDYDARMGPLDGRWHVMGPSGDAMLNLVLSDAGEAQPVEGGWRRPDARGRAGDVAPVQSVQRDLPGQVAVSLGQAGLLRLTVASDGQWVGLLIDDRGTHPVAVRRPA